MKITRFNEIVEAETERIKSILSKKQDEYNLDADRLSHFKRASALAQTTPEKVLYGYMLKHIMSISDMVVTDETYSKELWQEKMTDVHNYLILLLALLEDDNMFAEKQPKKAERVRLVEEKK